MGELGYNIGRFCFQDSPRRAHSIAAQGGSTRQRTIPVTGTVFIDYFTTPLRVAIFVLVKPMSID